MTDVVEYTHDPDGWSPGGAWVRMDLCWPLEPGDYNTMCRFVMSAAPIYHSFDGKEWIGGCPQLYSESDRDYTYHYSPWWNYKSNPAPLFSNNSYAEKLVIPDDPQTALRNRLELYKKKKKHALAST